MILQRPLMGVLAAAAGMALLLASGGSANPPHKDKPPAKDGKHHPPAKDDKPDHHKDKKANPQPKDDHLVAAVKLIVEATHEAEQASNHLGDHRKKAVDLLEGAKKHAREALAHHPKDEKPHENTVKLEHLPNVQGQPHVAAALQKMSAAQLELSKEPYSRNGHRGHAINDINHAIIELTRGLDHMAKEETKKELERRLHELQRLSGETDHYYKRLLLKLDNQLREIKTIKDRGDNAAKVALFALEVADLAATASKGVDALAEDLIKKGKMMPVDRLIDLAGVKNPSFWSDLYIRATNKGQSVEEAIKQAKMAVENGRLDNMVSISRHIKATQDKLDKLKK